MSKDARYRFLAESMFSITRLGSESNLLNQLESSREVSQFLDDGRFTQLYLRFTDILLAFYRSRRVSSKTEMLSLRQILLPQFLTKRPR
jgi:hypothetical protein